MSDKNWKDNSIQFPRLIAEADAAGAFTKPVVKEMAESMSLNRTEIYELVDRAQEEFEKIKPSALLGSKKRIEKAVSKTESIPVSNWREMKTAPRNGTHILVLTKEGHQTTAYFDLRRQKWFLVEPGAKMGVVEWLTLGEQPKAWMPLPLEMVNMGKVTGIECRGIWQKTVEHTPSFYTPVLVVFKTGVRDIASMGDSEERYQWFLPSGEKCSTPVYWMELPDPPLL